MSLHIFGEKNDERKEIYCNTFPGQAGIILIAIDFKSFSSIFLSVCLSGYLFSLLFLYGLTEMRTIILFLFLCFQQA